MLSFSAMRQAGIKARYSSIKDNLRKEIVVKAESFNEDSQPLIDRMVALLWDALEKS